MFEYIFVVFVSTTINNSSKYIIKEASHTIHAEECLELAEEFNSVEQVGSLTFAACMPLLDKSSPTPLE